MATEWISRDHVVAALDMSAVLQHYDIKPGCGSSFRIHCPFHDDERPSCSINHKDKLFNCFACGEHGTVLDFIGQLEGLDPRAEFRAVLETAIEIIGHNPSPHKKRATRKRLPQGRRHSNKDNRSYNKKRKSNKGNHESVESQSQQVNATPMGDNDNVGPEAPLEQNTPKPSSAPKRSGTSQDIHKADGTRELAANKVLVGPAFPLKLEAKHDWLKARLKRIGVSQIRAEEFGIGFEPRTNALMANRICVPIHNAKGDLVAYAGRWASSGCDEQGRYFCDHGREQPRYKLPKGFQKQLELYNWHRVQQQYPDLTTIVLVEGFWSVLRLHQYGIPCVALMGVSISDAQIELLKKAGIECVVVVMDGDDAGRKACQAILRRLARHVFVRAIDLPDGVSPDEADEDLLVQVAKICKIDTIDITSVCDAQPVSKCVETKASTPLNSLSTSMVHASLGWRSIDQSE